MRRLVAREKGVVGGRKYKDGDDEMKRVIQW